jgi:hypothetical protein
MTDPVTGAILWGTIFTAANYALTVYGLYHGYRMYRANKRAYEASLTDRSVSITVTDLARSTVYGRRLIGGTPVYLVEPRDEPESVEDATRAGHPPRPANEFFYAVIALEASHELDAIEDIFFDNVRVGPFGSIVPGNPYGDDPNVVEGGTGYYVASSSRYYRVEHGTRTDNGMVDPSGVILLPGVSIVRILSLAVAKVGDSGNNDGDWINDPEVVPEGSYVVGLGAVTMDAIYAGRRYVLTCAYQINQPMVRVWFYRGRNAEDYPGENIHLVNPYVQAASGGEWNANCRLLGCPYIILEIRPDLEIFPNGFPSVTVQVRGKRCLLPTGGKAYSANPVVHAYDYLRTNYDVPDSEIDLASFIAEQAECDLQVVSHYKADPVGINLLPMPVYIPRYANHVILSSEASRNDNLRVILSSMAGSLTWAGGKFSILAGVPHDISPYSLDDGDLADDGITVKPEPSIMEGYNCVRGRFADESQQYAITDFAPYKSPTYIEEDRGPDQAVGPEQWLELDLPGVTNSYQAQRIALLKLRLNRNALSFTAHYKSVIARLSAGDIVNVTNETFGWDNKPFNLVEKKRRPDGTFDTLMIEAALAIYSDDYQEATSADPSPNTRLTYMDKVPGVTGLHITSGMDHADYAEDQSLRAYAIVSWDLMPPAVSYGGKIELWYLFAGKTEWNKFSLPGDTINFKIRVQRDQQFVVKVRGVNGLQVFGAWSTDTHTAVDAPTEPIVGQNFLTNAQFDHIVQVDEPNLLVPNWYGVYNGNSPFYSFVNIYHQPIPLSIRKPDGTLYSSYQGFIGVDDPDGGTSERRVLNVFSEFFKIKHNCRLVAFVQHWSAYGRPQIGLEFVVAPSTIFFLNLSDIGQPRGVPYDDGTGLDQYQTVSMFMDIPDNTFWSSTSVRLVLIDYRESTAPTAEPTVIRWYRPLVAYASPGQIAIPPWTK